MAPSPTLADIPWTDLKALSFDIYGTLIDWQDGLIDAALATKLRPFLPTDRRELYSQLRKYDQEIEQDCPMLKKSEINAEAVRRYARDLGIVDQVGGLSPANVDAAAKQYGRALGSFPAFEDTIAAITRLASHYKLFPLSNIDHASFTQTLSGPLQGHDFFTAAYIPEDIGSYKPSPRNFHHLLDRLRSDFGVQKHELCHVAQSLYHDHAATKALGVRSLWVDRFGVLAASVGDRDEESLRDEYGFAARVESLREVADAADAAFAKVVSTS